MAIFHKTRLPHRIATALCAIGAGLGSLLLSSRSSEGVSAAADDQPVFLFSEEERPTLSYPSGLDTDIDDRIVVADTFTTVWSASTALAMGRSRKASAVFSITRGCGFGPRWMHLCG